MRFVKNIPLLIIFIFTLNANALFESYKASKAYLNSNFSEAEKLFSNLLTENPNDTKLLFNTGNTFYKQEKFKDAKYWLFLVNY